MVTVVTAHFPSEIFTRCASLLMKQARYSRNQFEEVVHVLEYVGVHQDVGHEAIAKNNDVLSTRHPGESRGPVPRAAGLKRLDSGVRRNDGIRPPRIGQNFWQLL